MIYLLSENKLNIHEREKVGEHKKHCPGSCHWPLSYNPCPKRASGHAQITVLANRHIASNLGPAGNDHRFCPRLCRRLGRGQ